jgi:predicted glycosyltransferase/CheY-like chemotaxis protein
MSGRKIMIVEDEMLVQLHLERTMRSMGHVVTATSMTATEAIEAAEIETPDLVLIDVNLPGARDGISTARELKERFGCAIVFATAHADEQTLERSQSVGGCGYLIKPFTSPELRAAVNGALALKDSEPEAPPWKRTEERIEMPAFEKRPFGAGTRMLFYSHDTFGMGHLQRSLKLIGAAMELHPDISVLLVTGSPVVHRYELPAGADYVKLPAVQKVGSSDYASRSLLMSGPGVRNLRTNLLLRVVQDYDPNVLFVDHSPAGMQGEMVPALEWLTERTQCRRVLGLRDVTDDAANVRALWKEQGIYELLQRHYDDVVVFGNKEIYDPVREYQLPHSIRNSVSYLGFVCEQRVSIPEPVPSSKPRVAVSIGGGDGAISTIFAYLEMLKHHSDSLNVHSEVLTGPLVSDEDMQEVLARAEGLPVVVHKFMPSTSEFFAHADLVVATAGYNTVTQILQYAKRAVLIPRVLYRREQLVRARRLEELGLVGCLHPMDISPARLAEALTRALEDTNEPLTAARSRGSLPLDGAQRFAEHCGEFMIDVAAGDDAAHS